MENIASEHALPYGQQYALDNGGYQYGMGSTELHYRDVASVSQDPFSAVLQQILQQTQPEIEARNSNLGWHIGPSHRSEFQATFKDSTCHYKPLVDPTISYISKILAEDNEPDNNPFLSPEEYLAFQAKAAEVAKILWEDSPALLQTWDGRNPSSPESWNMTSVSEDSCLESAGILNLSQLESDHGVAEASMNELLLTSLRGPVGRPVLNFQQPYFQEVSLLESGVDGLVTRPGREGSQDDIGIRPHGQKQLYKKSEKTATGLKSKSATRKKSGGKARSSKDGDQELVDLSDLLLLCAQAVGVNNTTRAVEILNKVKQHCSPYGKGAQRLAYYFAEALEARFSGTGWPLYLGLLRRPPSSMEVLRATFLYMASCPFVKAYHYFINQSIINVAQRASKLHIMELQVDGFQYPALFNALANRPGGPPEVHVIGLCFPHYSTLPVQTDIVMECTQKIGRQLAACAAAYGVPFQYTPWAGHREDLCMQDFASPYRSPDETLVILSTSLLRYVMDETLDSSVLRSKLLKQGRDMNPDVYVQGIVTGSYNTPFFTRRFKEALFHLESVFDMLDNFIERDKTDRLVFESEILGKAILHIVACEGSEVIERVDKYKHWQAVTEDVGFQQLPLDEEIKNTVQANLKSWHKEYTVTEDSQYLLMGWKGRMLHAMSTWKASPEEVP